MSPTYIDPKTKKTVDLTSYGDAGAQNLQANKMGLDIAPQTPATITPSSLTPATPITVPPTPIAQTIDTTATQAVIDAQNKMIAETPTQPNQPTQTKEPSAIESFLSGLKKPESQTGAYQTAYTEAGLPAAEKDILAKQGVVKTAQSKLANINAQLGALNAEATAIPIQIQKEAEARGVTAGGVAPIQAARLRENALKALPLQAQALVAQAEVQSAQGDVELAQNSMKMASDRLTTLFNLHVKDAEAEYTYNKDLRDKVYEFATKAEQAKLDALNKEDERNFQLMKDNINNAQVLSKTALDAGQSDLAARITQLDPKSKTYREDLAALQTEIKPDTLDRTYKQLQIEKLQQDIASTGSTQGADENTIAYAQQYATTGTIPTGMPKGTFGKVAEIAKSTPRPQGEIVNRITGVKDSKLPATQQEDFAALYDITQKVKRLKELDKNRSQGLISAGVGKVFGSQAQSEYLTLRKSIVDDIARMQTGAALTLDEQAFYNDYLPGRVGTVGFVFGQNTQKKIENFEKVMNERLTNRSAANGLSIYGYTPIKLGGKEYRVGDTIEINGVQGRVLPDGTIATQ